ncbi:peptidyl-tRNA hydrolase PTH2 domain-containing protein [Ditylenchus destructor]|nr:peptidyl-tRNA hydrolase PTH2 domain-containing protein [Ditylenchus destructor]
MSNRVLYMILRADLSSELKWPLGAVFTQIAHASTACIWTYKEDPDVIAYMGELDKMHKVTLRVENEEQLLAEAKKLETNNIAHKVWIEDDMSVCIAIKPYSRDFIKPFLKHLPLYK